MQVSVYMCTCRYCPSTILYLHVATRVHVLSRVNFAGDDELKGRQVRTFFGSLLNTWMLFIVNKARNNITISQCMATTSVCL